MIVRKKRGQKGKGIGKQAAGPQLNTDAPLYVVEETGPAMRGGKCAPTGFVSWQLLGQKRFLHTNNTGRPPTVCDRNARAI